MPGLLGRNLRVDDGARPAPLDPCIRLAHAGSDQRKAKYTRVTQAAQKYAHGTNSAARWHLPFQELSTHVLPCTNPRPLALLRTNKPSRAEWVAAVHHISVLMGPTRSLIAALSTPPTHLPPSVALRLPPFLGTRTRFEIKKGTGFFFDIHVKFVTDFPYCQVFDRQFFVLDVKQIRKSTFSFGLLVQMEGKF